MDDCIIYIKANWLPAKKIKFCPGTEKHMHCKQFLIYVFSKTLSQIPLQNINGIFAIRMINILSKIMRNLRNKVLDAAIQLSA